MGKKGATKLTKQGVRDLNSPVNGKRSAPSELTCFHEFDDDCQCWPEECCCRFSQVCRKCGVRQ